MSALLTRQLAVQRRGVALAAIVVTAVVVGSAALAAARYDGPGSASAEVLRASFGPNLGLSAFAAVGPVLGIALGVAALGNERRWGTLASRIAHHGRAASVVAAMAWMAVLGAVLVVGSGLVGLITVVVVGVTTGVADPLGPAAPLGALPFHAVVAWAGFTVWGVAGVLASLLARSRAVGVLVLVVYAYVETLVLAPLGPSATAWLPATVQATTIHAFVHRPEVTLVNPPLVSATVGPLPGTAVTLVWTAVLAVVCVAVARSPMAWDR